MDNSPSERLASLLYAVKRLEFDSPLDCVRAALTWCYTEHMNLRDCVHHALNAWWELRGNSRFEVGGSSHVDAIEEVVLAPIRGITSIEMLGPKGADTEYSVDAWYTAVLQRMLNDLAVARVDWCADALYAAGKRISEWKPRSEKE